MKLFSLIILAGTTFFGCWGKKSNNQMETTNADTSVLYKKYHLDKIKLPPGFSISVYAEVPDARSITLSPSGILYVGNRSEDKVYAVADENKDGRADKVYTLAKGLNTPNGVAFKNGNLYIATISQILKLEGIESKLANPPAPVIVYDKFPKDTHHGWKFIAFGPDGKLYVPVGAPCNICEKHDPVYSSITRLNEDGTGFEIFAKGIRNSVGFAWHPATKNLWFTENGRDMMGDDIPGDELNTAATTGMHFGFPYCHQGNTLDPEFGKGKKCEDYTAPIRVLDPHVAALGMRFYTGNIFPAEYKHQVFIAEHGSWNRSEPVGYKISLVKLDAAGKSSGRTDFATGWLQRDGKVLGRPVDVEVMPDGAVLVSDDYSGAVYRISYKK
ncbi:MAG: sorbosone dehydrogenase family protein [Rhizobacter sp.]|nr:sorbosone dehydrogenase family protein [Ferruginibacter sp.]